jgi:hypothetical protein
MIWPPLTPERDPHIHGIEDSVGSRIGVETVEYRKIT